jgi:hypothetical protein
LQTVANPAFLGLFPFSGLHGVAPYCAPGGVRVVSISLSYSALTEGYWTRFYDLLRRVAMSPSAVATAAPRFTVGCICSQL